ncbi:MULTISPECIES: ATP-binding cassette domain-containing protein [Catenuloplanes]|uniref:ATP-binding cassette subfamily B protein n=1 Tax=Catenuloplanes niger TaxID=587534 RepID=A0AAE4CXV0_9ACTN|nr:ATP-binding cassette domain-containing protein [Catenuloplanes niger]MDR7326983.1 ATP-binding cassette subfamily B protein [Catenuloplanes niger]
MISTAVLLLRNAWRADPRRILTAAGFALGGALAGPLIAAALAAMTGAVLTGRPVAAAVSGAAVAVLAVAALTFTHFGHVFWFELSELAELDFDRDLAALSNGSDGIAHHERADLADRFTLLQRESRQFHTGLGAVLGLGGLVLAVPVTAVLLARVSPLLLFLPLAVLPPLAAARLAERVLDRARTAAAEPTRVARHLFGLVTSPRYAGELRVAGVGGLLLDRHAALWRTATGLLTAGQLRAAAIRAAGQALFAPAYGAAVLVAVDRAAGAGTVVLVVALAVQVNAQFTAAVALVRDLQRIDTAYRHAAEVRAAVAGTGATGDGEVPDRLRTGITLDGVSFRRPGADRAVLRDVHLTLPAGATVAVIGENGAGKSTLIKLLCGLYTPTTGRILVDGVDLRRIPAARWRDRLSAGFQDHVRFEFPVRETVGVGDLPRLGDDRAVRDALSRAGAEAMVDALPRGLDSPLGTAYTDGTGLSGGQWQRLALGRAFMRRTPLLLVLDEPASALDPDAEHRLFDRYAAQASAVAARAGAITVFVSHRFSTVRAADLIVVLRDGRVAEAGDHETLLAAGGAYAGLYAVQAAAYR